MTGMGSNASIIEHWGRATSRAQSDNVRIFRAGSVDVKPHQSRPLAPLRNNPWLSLVGDVIPVIWRQRRGNKQGSRNQYGSDVKECSMQ